MYFLTNAIEKVKWIAIEQKLYDKAQNKKVPAPFYHLNIVNEYNYNMNNVDIADQLRGTYRWDKWMRKRKWWWSIYFWVCQMLLTNCYITYKKYMVMHKHKYLSQYDFKSKVCLCWIDSRFIPKTGKRKAESSPTVAEVTVTNEEEMSCLSSTRLSGTVWCSRVNDRSLDETAGSLKIRLNHQEQHWPSTPIVDDARCQLHAWATGGNKYRMRICYCSTCNVNLCVDCYRLFHTQANLKGMKESLCLQFGGTVVIK